MPLLISVMHPCTGEGQNNFLPHICKTERHATAETLSASSCKGHWHYRKKPLTRVHWQPMERYGPALLMQRGCHHCKWNFSSSEIMTEISPISPGSRPPSSAWQIYKNFTRASRRCLLRCNVLYFFWSSLPQKHSPARTGEWYCLALFLMVECWHCYFALCRVLEY